MNRKKRERESSVVSAFEEADAVIIKAILKAHFSKGKLRRRAKALSVSKQRFFASSYGRRGLIRNCLFYNSGSTTFLKAFQRIG